MKIEYLPFTGSEREQYQQILAVGNLMVESINKTFSDVRKGYKKLHHCRKLILSGALKVTPHELQVVKQVEAIKFRFIQAHIAKVKQIVKKKVRFARFYSNYETLAGLVADLEAEAMNAILHAIYMYTDEQENFMHFMTTVVHNWLSNYCAETYPIIALDNISDLLRAYHEIRHKLIKHGLPHTFEDVIPVMIRHELIEMDIIPTEEAIAKRTRKRAKKYRVLEFAIKSRGDASKIQQIIAPTVDGDAELMVEELNDMNLNQLQRACLMAKANGESLRTVARAFDVKPHVVHLAFNRVKKLLQPV